jgi:uncharacterized protein YkwD
MHGRIFAAVSGVALLGTAPAPADETPWAAWSASPRPVDPAALDALERAALQTCGAGDAGLHDTARTILARKLLGLPLPELDAIEAAQRQAGEPHPWPRVWAASARTLDPDPTLARLGAWVGASKDGRLRRCGVAAGTLEDGTHVLVVVAVDALADLAPLPTRVRTGQWLTVEARLRTPARGGRVMVMDTDAAPRTVPSWFDGTTLRARFAPDRPGEIAIQVVADLASGPRPVLEATVFADVDPPPRETNRAAPGEDAAPGAPDDDRLAAMVAAARTFAGLPALARDARLDAVSREHARYMAAAHELAHDAGDGDPLGRLGAAGLDPPLAGENVAHAPSVSLVHRALWASPSHRANLLGREFDHLGVAVVRDEHGDAWAVETFAGGSKNPRSRM